MITGDFRYHTHGNYYPVYKEIEALTKHLSCNTGVMCIYKETTISWSSEPKLEAHGIHMLLNESAFLEKNGERLSIIGLDDAHFYGLHDYARAFTGVPDDTTRILMMHSPETLEDACERGTDLYCPVTLTVDRSVFREALPCG